MGKWISVKDKLPEPDELVLLYRACHLWNKPSEKWQDFSVGERSKNFNHLNSMNCEEGVIEDVTHWQPLPEPPKTENEPS